MTEIPNAPSNTNNRACENNRQMFVEKTIIIQVKQKHYTFM